MCGICGFFGQFDQLPAQEAVLRRMTAVLKHRGPDDEGYHLEPGAGFGFRRLSFLDLRNGNQPLYNADRSLVLVANGEIYNYRELKRDLVARGYQFRSETDVEVLLYLYEEYGVSLLDRLNGQFAFAIYDSKQRLTFLARDHFGINPLYYTRAGGTFLFASEIKAILQHPAVTRDVDLTALDQLLTFPGPVSPRTLFRDIHSLKSGHYLLVTEAGIAEHQYWDLDYPRVEDATEAVDERECVETLRGLLADSVALRLHADVPVGFYLSGGLDSSLIAALTRQAKPAGSLHSFAIDFGERDFSERPFQRMMAQHVQSVHHTRPFQNADIAPRLPQVIYHCESPLKETYNTASLELAESARSEGVKAVLTGEGADELFAGYVGYRFDSMRGTQAPGPAQENGEESELRRRLWGDSGFFYEHDYAALRRKKLPLYAKELQNRFGTFDCLREPVIDATRVAGRHPVHQRSYIDCKLRMSDHLLSDHGDRMALANSVEARYPFLDIRFAEFAAQVPPCLKLNGLTEKYVLRKAAENLVPPKILRREKYAFVAPGSPHILRENLDWVEDLLSPSRIQREGYFDPAVVSSLKSSYSKPGFNLDLPFETDLLIVVLTFGLFLETFQLPHLN